MELPDDVVNLIENSGNTFHAKVFRWLSSNRWHVVVSPYYMDQTQNKAREIDLVAEKVWPIQHDWNNSADDVVVRLFIECKFVPSTSVFWFADKDRESAESLVCRGKHFQRNNTYTKEHHYLAQSSKVAKLFATKADKSQENEPFYKALNQALNAMVAMSGRPVSAPSLRKAGGTPSVLLEFPVIVCNSFDRLYSVDFNTESTQPITENFQLEVRYAYVDRRGKHQDEYFLLDVVDFSQFEKFADAVDHDGQIAELLARK